MIRFALFLILLAMAAAGVGWLGENGIPPLVVVHAGEQVHVAGPKEAEVTHREPGRLAWRIPFLTRATAIDTRLRRSELGPLAVGDDGTQMKLQVWWRVADAARLIEAGSEGAPGETRVIRILDEALRGALSGWDLGRSRGDSHFEDQLLAAARAALPRSGVEVLAVESTGWSGEALLRAMSGSRTELRDTLRREVRELGARMRAEARSEAARIESESIRDADIARGQSEAEVARIYAEAHQVAPEFYTFSRQLEAYRNTLGPNTTLVLSPDHEFFRFLAPSAPPAER